MALFDRLPPATIDDLRGQWVGRGIHSGHALDGMLEAFGWHGKRLDDAETAFPLLFRNGFDRCIALDPRFLPLRLAARLQVQRRAWAPPGSHLAKLLMGSNRPSAHLRVIAHRNVHTAVMVYDALPVIDVFSRVDAYFMMGAMDWRFSAQPLFFVSMREHRG